MLHMENTEQRGTRIENGSEWSNGTVRSNGYTERSGPPREMESMFSKLLRLDQTDPFSFGPKFPGILVE